MYKGCVILIQKVALKKSFGKNYGIKSKLTSEIVSGNFDPNVSGKIMARIPATKLQTPIIIRAIFLSIAARIGAAIPPNLQKRNCSKFIVLNI